MRPGLQRGSHQIWGLPCFLLLTIASAGNAFGQVQYTVTDLGTLPGEYGCVATGINDSGQVVGYGYDYGSPYDQAFLYSGGSMQNLSTLPGSNSSTAYAINNSGQVVGSALTSSGAQTVFLYSGGSLQNLGVAGQPTAINDSGQIVGNNGNTAFLYSGGSIHNLGTFGGNSSTANAINDLGQVVGGAYTSGGVQDAFLYSGGSMQNLGTLPGAFGSYATSINDSGQVVGWSISSVNIYHSFLWQSGNGMQDIGVLGPLASDAVNNLGQVVMDNYLYSSGSIENLNNLIVPGSGCTLNVASGINDSGQICGWGGNSSGQTVALLLTPVNVNGKWGVNSGGTWSASDNWTGGVPGGSAVDTAVFGPVLTSGTATITLDSSRSLSSLGFSTTGANSYVISPSGASSLTLSNAAGTATISNSGGKNAIDAPIILDSNLSVSATAGSVLTIAGGISESGGSYLVSLSGGGELILSGSNSYRGGTNVNAGTLYVTDSAALPVGTSLMVGPGAKLVFDSSATAATIADSAPAVTVAPEPSTIALLGTSAIGLIGYAWRRRRAGKQGRRSSLA